MRAVKRGDRVELTIGSRQLRGGVAANEAPPARPTLGGSRSAQRGYTGRAGRCRRPRHKFGFRQRRAPSVRRRRRCVCHCVSAQPCLDCSPTQAEQTLLGLAIACRSGSLWSRRSGDASGSSALVVLGAVVGLGWLGVDQRARPTGPTRGRLPDRARRCQARRRRRQRALMSAQRWLDRAGVGWHPPGQPRSAGRSRGAGVPASPRAARPSIRAREVAWP
jgi:hypothetical protein